MQRVERERLLSYCVRILAADARVVSAEPHQLRKLREPDAEDVEQTGQRARKPEPVIVCR